MVSAHYSSFLSNKVFIAYEWQREVPLAGRGESLSHKVDRMIGRKFKMNQWKYHNLNLYSFSGGTNSFQPGREVPILYGKSCLPLFFLNKMSPTVVIVVLKTLSGVFNARRHYPWSPQPGCKPSDLHSSVLTIKPTRPSHESSMKYLPMQSLSINHWILEMCALNWFVYKIWSPLTFK